MVSCRQRVVRRLAILSPELLLLLDVVLKTLLTQDHLGSLHLRSRGDAGVVQKRCRFNAEEMQR